MQNKSTLNDSLLRLTLPMLRLLSAKAQECKIEKPPKPCHVGIHWIALTESSTLR